MRLSNDVIQPFLSTKFNTGRRVGHMTQLLYPATDFRQLLGRQGNHVNGYTTQQKNRCSQGKPLCRLQKHNKNVHCSLPWHNKHIACVLPGGKNMYVFFFFFPRNSLMSLSYIYIFFFVLLPSPRVSFASRPYLDRAHLRMSVYCSLRSSVQCNVDVNLWQSR